MLDCNVASGVGSSSACSSETYHGQHAFSEQETLNIRHLVETHYNNLISYLSVHSYSQLLLKPWGYTTSASVVPPNINDLVRILYYAWQLLSSRQLDNC